MKVVSIGAIIVMGVMSSKGARADELTGLWHETGSTAQGAYTATIGFGENNFFSYDFLSSGDPTSGWGRGTARCEGSYQYDGRYLSTQYSTCVACFESTGQCLPSQLADSDSFRPGIPT